MNTCIYITLHYFHGASIQTNDALNVPQYSEYKTQREMKMKHNHTINKITIKL